MEVFGTGSMLPEMERASQVCADTGGCSWAHSGFQMVVDVDTRGREEQALRGKWPMKPRALGSPLTLLGPKYYLCPRITGRKTKPKKQPPHRDL